MRHVTFSASSAILLSLETCLYHYSKYFVLTAGKGLSKILLEGARCGHPRHGLRVCCQPALKSALPSWTLPRSNSECCCSPSGSMIHTKRTQSCACAGRRLQALLGLMVTVPSSCPAQEGAGKMPQRGHRLVITSLAGTGFASRREAGRKGL